MSQVERFSPSARRVLGAAQEEAVSLANNAIETPHILLAMLHPDSGVAYRVLADLRIEHERVLPVVKAAHPGEPAPIRNPSIAPETKRLLESAVDIARKRGDHYVGSEHFLLALVKGDDKSIRFIMREIKLEPSVVRSCIERVLAQGQDDLSTTQPFGQDEPVITGPITTQQIERLKLPPEPDSPARTKVLEMVNAGRISAAEGAELLKAMRFAAVPIPGDAGFVLLPIDGVNFDDLRQRMLRFTVTGVNGEKTEIMLPFEQAQTQLHTLLRAVYSGGQGKLVELGSGQNRISVSLE
jgi:Clp amino terminal domain, pathogenicity island component/SHOCT-like domain